MHDDDDCINLFVLSTGFQYYFARLLIPYLGLRDVRWIMYQPREKIEVRAGADYPVLFADASDPATRRFGKKVGKYLFARRAARDIGIDGRRVRVFSPYYNESFVYALRMGLEQRAASVEYNMIPDGGALLRNLPGKARGSAGSGLQRLLYRVEPASIRHKSGSWSAFLNKVYHFPASHINCDPAKLEVVPIPDSGTENNGDWLMLGGLKGISREFVLEVKRRAAGRRVWYRMHPKVRDGIEHIHADAPEWGELQVNGILEEHLLSNPYHTVVGYYSSAVVFNQLFVTASQSQFIVDRSVEDSDYHATADAIGIPVTVL